MATELYARGMAAMVPEEAARQNAAVCEIARMSLAEKRFLIEAEERTPKALEDAVTDAE